VNKTVQRQKSTVEARDGRLLYLGTSHQARVHEKYTTIPPRQFATSSN
jgi:hypothetical protein